MLYEPGYEVQSGHEGDDACWLDAIIKREAELEIESFVCRIRPRSVGFRDANHLNLQP